MAVPTEHTPTLTSFTTRDDLSLLYRVLRVIIRPLRPRLVKPGKPVPAGSPRLNDHPKSKNGCHIAEQQDQVTGLWLYDFIPSDKTNTSTTTKKQKILYFAGGGFQSPPASEHWGFISKLASDQQLRATHSFTIVSYPLAPNSPACDSLPVLRDFLKTTCQDAAQNGHTVTLMGDSAGGNVALSLGLWWIDQISGSSQEQPQLRQNLRGYNPDNDGDEEATIAEDDIAAGAGTTTTPTTTTGTGTKNVTTNVNSDSNLTYDQPKFSDLRSTLSNILVISPAADLRNSNPAILEADKHDPVLSASLIEQTAAAWTLPSPKTQGRQQEQQAPPSLQPIGHSNHALNIISKESRSNPYHSPILTTTQTLKNAKRLGIKIHGVYGTHDVLAPDADLFRQNCIDAGVMGNWLVWEGQMHCFVLAGIYGMREGKEGIRWVVNVLTGSI